MSIETPGNTLENYQALKRYMEEYLKANDFIWRSDIKMAWEDMPAGKWSKPLDILISDKFRKVLLEKKIGKTLDEATFQYFLKFCPEFEDRLRAVVKEINDDQRGARNKDDEPEIFAEETKKQPETNGEDAPAANELPREPLQGKGSKFFPRGTAHIEDTLPTGDKD